MTKNTYTDEQRAEQVARVNAFRDQGMTMAEACDKAKVSRGNYSIWKLKVEGRPLPPSKRTKGRRKYKKRGTEEPSNQVIVYKPEAKDRPAPRTTKPAPQMTLVIGTPDQIAELLKGR